jgi:hypothetical protein
LQESNTNEELRCYGTQRQNIFSKIPENNSLIFYHDMKYTWGREGYNE